jgi:glycopeptide antibiotics resistance protein
MKKASKPDKRNITKRIILGMGIAYLMFLIWAILWKCGTPFTSDGTQRTINLLPLSGNTSWELQFNIAVFIPFGFFLSACSSKPKFLRLIVTTLLLSFAFEGIQFALAIGRSDITDLLMNTLGGLIGIAAFYVLSKLFERNGQRVIFIVCILLTLLMLYMTVSFIFFGQVNLGFMIIRL